MKLKTFNSLLLISALLVSTIFSTSCDRNFYLSEREFYALQSQFRTEVLANQFFGDMQGGQLRITFDNSTTPPRVQSSNLLEFMRARLTTFSLIEGFPFQYLQGERVSGEIERQFDNFLADRLSLYIGGNNAEARLTRVDEIRLMFLNNPNISFSSDGIDFDTTLQMTADCTVQINALDPLSNILFGGVNGTYNVAVDVQTLRLRGNLNPASPNRTGSDLNLRLIPGPGTVVVRERGSTVPNVVKEGIAKVVKQNLAFPVEENFKQDYEHFGLDRCLIDLREGFSCNYNPNPKSPNPEAHAAVRGTDNKLYLFSRHDDVWANQEVHGSNQFHPVTFTSDPNMTASSARTVEIVASTGEGKLFYSQRNGGWGNYILINPVIPPNTPPLSIQNYHYRGKPALIASAPGQLEVVTARGNRTIVHLRRLNGNWTSPSVLDLPTSSGTFPNTTFFTYRDPVAVQSGNKVFLSVTGNNRLYAMVFDMETGLWGQSSQIPTAENVNFPPTLVASGDGRVDLVYVGQSGAIYHRPIDLMPGSINPGVGTTAFSLHTEIPIQGNVNATPVLVATGYRQLGLIARGTDYKLYYNRFVGTHQRQGAFEGQTIAAGWNGWGDLNGNFIGTQIFSNGEMEGFGAVATKTGKLDVLSLLRPNSVDDSTLHYNNYDAARFGNQPWKTVHWRGFQKLGDREFVGRPALATLDGNFEIAYGGQNSNIFHAQYGANFIQRSNFQLFSNSAGVADPIVVSGGKALVDLIAVGTDQKIKHIRQYNRFTAFTTTLPGQTNLTFQKRPAVVGYGDGQLDVIGVTTANTIYHWRLLNGTWQQPRQISGSVISPPVLVNTGSGQLEFFALGGDNKMYRWRFLGGAWGNWQQLPSAFPINANYFGQGSATTWGDGTVDLAVVRQQAGTLIYHRRVEPRDDTVSIPNQPAQTFQNIGSGAGDQPFIAAYNRNEKLIVVKDAFNQTLNEYVLERGNWVLRDPDEKTIGLRMGGLVADSNYFSSVATDRSGKIYLRQTSWRLSTDFFPVLEQSPGTLLGTPLFRPAIASLGGQ